MRLKFLKGDFTVCKLRDLSRLNLAAGLFFLAKTAEEISLVCPTGDAPDNAIRAEPGWRAFRVEGQLDFSLVGILARLSALLAERNISLFAASTFDTDYILIKADKEEEAKIALREGGYEVN